MIRLCLIVCLTIGIHCSAAFTAPSSTKATFVLRNGELIERTTYDVNSIYKTIEVEVGGKKRIISFSDIASVNNEDGKDITYEVIRQNARPIDGQRQQQATPVPDTVGAKIAVPDSVSASQAPDTVLTPRLAFVPDTVKPVVKAETNDSWVKPINKTWEDAGSESYRRKQRALWSAFFTVGPNYTFPMAEYYSGISGGLGIECNVMFPVNRHIGVGGWLSYAKLGMDENEIRTTVPSRYSRLLINDVKYSATSFALLAHYYGAWRNGNGKWDVFTGLGFVNHSSSGQAIYYDPQSDQAVGLTFKEETKFAIPFGLSVSRLFTKSVGIEAQTVLNTLFISRNQIYYSYSSSNSLQYAFLWSFRVGLILAIPKGE